MTFEELYIEFLMDPQRLRRLRTLSQEEVDQRAVRDEYVPHGGVVHHVHEEARH